MLSLLESSKLSKWYWPYAVKCSTYLGNRIGSRMLKKFRTPYETFWKKKPDIKHLVVFGSHGYAMDGKSKRKMQKRGRPAIFLGYNTNMRSYIVKWRDTNSIGVARTGKWNEMNVQNENVPVSEKNSLNDLRNVLENVSVNSSLSKHGEKNAEGIVMNHEEGVPESHSVSESNENETVINNGNFRGWCNVEESNIISEKRNRRPKKIFDPSDIAKKAIVKMSKLQAPKRFAEIEYRPDKEEWLKSYYKEINSLETIGDFEIIDRNEVPSGRQILPVLELFTVKSDGRKKSRIVVRGDLQKERNLEVYSPTANVESVRLIIAVVANFGWKLRQLDVSNAYLHGRTKEPTFIELPSGHEKRDGKRKVYKTFSSIYGLKQAPRVWNQTIHDFLIEYGFKCCPVEKCLYMKERFYLILYVDDILYAASNNDEVSDFETEIQKRFAVKFEKDVKKFLGFEILEEENSIFIKQEKYIEKMIDTFGLTDAKSLAVPMQPNLDLEKNNGDELVDEKLYQALLGALLYVNMQTRADICYSVNVLSRYAKRPTITHLKMLKNILKYLKSCPDLGIRYRKGSKLELSLDVDSSWGNGPKRRSMFGYVISLNGSALKFRTKMQSITALSSTEAEYIGICAGVKELMFVRNMLEFLKVELEMPMKVYNDNQSAIKIGKDLSSVARTKHIEMRYFYVQQLVEKGLILLEYKQTDHMVADMMTKALGKNKFQKLRELLLDKENRQDEEGVVHY